MEEDNGKKKIYIMDDDYNILDIKEMRPQDHLKTHIYTDEQYMAMNRKKKMSKWDCGVFGKLFLRMVPYLQKELTGNEWMFCTCLLPLVSYSDCIIRKGGATNGNAIQDFKELSDILGYSYSQTCRHMRSLIKKQVVICAYTGDGDNRVAVYLMNPYIFFLGNYINNSVIKCFSETRWATYNEEISKGGNLEIEVSLEK